MNELIVLQKTSLDKLDEEIVTKTKYFEMLKESNNEKNKEQEKKFKKYKESVLKEIEEKKEIKSNSLIKENNCIKIILALDVIQKYIKCVIK